MFISEEVAISSQQALYFPPFFFFLSFHFFGSSVPCLGSMPVTLCVTQIPAATDGGHVGHQLRDDVSALVSCGPA